MREARQEVLTIYGRTIFSLFYCYYVLLETYYALLETITHLVISIFDNMTFN